MAGFSEAEVSSDWVSCQNELFKKAGHVRTLQRWQRHSKYELQALRLFHNSNIFYTFIFSLLSSTETAAGQTSVYDLQMYWFEMYKISGQRLSQNVPDFKMKKKWNH